MCNESSETTAADDAADWVPQACTLPTVERPLRVSEFDQLFGSALRGLDRPAATLLQLRLDRSADEWARELTARETECCSFFGFAFSSAGEQVTIEVTVPAAHVPVLDALATRARASLAAA